VLLSFLRSAAHIFAITVPLNSLFGVRPRGVNLTDEETRLAVQAEVNQPEFKKLPFLELCMWVVSLPEDFHHVGVNKDVRFLTRSSAAVRGSAQDKPRDFLRFLRRIRGTLLSNLVWTRCTSPKPESASVIPPCGRTLHRPITGHRRTF
jgi:hypothetical protein